MGVCHFVRPTAVIGNPMVGRFVVSFAATSIFAVTMHVAEASLDDEQLPPGCELMNSGSNEGAAVALGNAAFPPLQLEVEVPFAPNAFPAAGRTFLIYEVYLRNFLPIPLNLRSLGIVDPATSETRVIGTLDEDALAPLLRPIGRVANSEDSDAVDVLPGGGSTAVFVCIAFQRGVQLPARLSHLVMTEEGAILGPVVEVDSQQPIELGPPLQGGNWFATSGPGNESYHRRGILLLNGSQTLSRRFAIDWIKYEREASFAGDQSDVTAHFSYGARVLAVADGVVLAAMDGVPDNVPRTAAGGFRPAIEMSLDTIPGNAITLDLGNEQFAHYMHLRLGSLQVKAGDRVRRGQTIAQIGNSGDSRRPHLHFDVSTSPTMIAGQGVPYVINEFSVRLPDESWEMRTHESPLSDLLIDFGR
jgi:hypothetical protein